LRSTNPSLLSIGSISHDDSNSPFHHEDFSMGMTIVEKVMARNAGLATVHPGQYVDCKLDRVIAHEEFYRIHTAAENAGFKGGLPDIWDRDGFHVILDHFQPVINESQALRQRKIREVAEAYRLKHFD